MKKNGRKVTGNYNENIKYTLGTMDKTDFNSFYITINSWVKGIGDEYTNYDKIISMLVWKIKNEIVNTKMGFDFIKNKSIVEFDYSSKNLNQGKSVFLNAEFNFYLEDKTKSFNDIQKHLKTFIDKLLTGKLLDLPLQFSMNKQ